MAVKLFPLFYAFFAFIYLLKGVKWGCPFGQTYFTNKGYGEGIESLLKMTLP